MITNPSTLVPNRPIKRFRFILTDIRTSFTGEEEIRISFMNSSLIRDTANNTITPGYFASDNPYPYMHLTEFEETCSEAIGQSIKFTVMSSFSFNVAAKLLLKSSM